MRKKILLAGVIALAISSTVLAQRRSAGASSKAEEPRTIIVTMTDSGFQPNVLVLDGQPGAKIHFDVRNESKKPHGLRIEIAGQEFGLDGALGPGKTTNFELTLPTRNGLGTFYSPVGDDRQHGFQGRAMLNTSEAVGG